MNIACAGKEDRQSSMGKQKKRHSYNAPCSTSRLGRRVKRSSWSTAPLAIVLIWLGSSTSTIRGLAGAVIHSNAFSGLPLPLPTAPKRSKPCDLRGKDVFCIVRSPATSVRSVLQVHSITLSSAPDSPSLHSMPFTLAFSTLGDSWPGIVRARHCETTSPKR